MQLLVLVVCDMAVMAVEAVEAAAATKAAAVVEALDATTAATAVTAAAGETAKALTQTLQTIKYHAHTHLQSLSVRSSLVRFPFLQDATAATKAAAGLAVVDVKTAATAVAAETANKSTTERRRGDNSATSGGVCDLVSGDRGAKVGGRGLGAGRRQRRRSSWPQTGEAQ